MLGGHEDVANARLEFECGCVATLSASRVSYEPVRRMQVWSARAFAGIDFAARTATLVRPSETLLRRQFRVDRLDAGADRALPPAFCRRAFAAGAMAFDAVDALALEQDDFVESIRTPRATARGRRGGPRRLGRGRADSGPHPQPLAGTPRSMVRPVRLALPRRHVIPAPHFNLGIFPRPAVHDKAG